ncbi:S24 family peptidase [Serratia sp. MF2]|uniref:helix-turn-helix domain-containing protein n=1 Tax=Serratia sp. MF2 TaxID=3059173 RepID=UPI0027F31AF5|nr:S24 family peptidase [Serratia sp. MF2]MDQ7101916.1 S24 family peptidase [Serratia sp. MF2]
MTFAERLKLAMDEGSFTQGSLAKKVGIAQSMIWKLLNGKANGTTKMLEMCKVLGVRPEWLVDGQEPMRGDKVGIVSETEGIVFYDDIFPVQFFDSNGFTGHYVMAPLQVKSNTCRAYKLNVNSGCADAPAGTMIIVDTAEEAGTGDLVYAVVNNQYSVYKFVQGGELGFLSVDDSRVPLMPIDSNVEIIGVVVFLLRSLKNR